MAVKYSFRMLLNVAIILSVSVEVTAITHMKNLLWTEKDLKEGIVYIKGIPGEPSEWVNSTVRYFSISFFRDAYSQNVSSRVALGFNYGTRTIFSSDGGFKEIYGITLADTSAIPYVYNVTMNVVYTGISTQVNGLAVDWLSESVYWTDALYDWVLVAKCTALNVYNHLFVDGLDKPFGIAVFPKKGLLFFSDLGVNPKIERSTLGGENRTLFIHDNIVRPMGLTIDYDHERLYWVDDWLSSIESCNMNGLGRISISLVQQGIHNAKLFGIATYKDYAFIADQEAMSIRSFNKTSGTYISQVSAGIFEGFDGIPYDIIYYDGSQQENSSTRCIELDCEDICISMPNSAARCICRHGYVLSSDGRSCKDDGKMKKPQYLYSVGESLCATYVMIADLQDATFLVDCFWNAVGHRMTSLDFHNYAELLYFTDESDRVIHRIRLDETPSESNVEVVANNIGTIKGIAVDWIADNLYYLNSDTGTITVCRLNGRYPRELISGIVNGNSLGVNPHKGWIYWATGDTIYTAGMDGSGVRPMIHVDGGKFDGMVVDIRRDTLYWVDNALPGIRACRLNGTGLEVVLIADDTNGFHDVTVYQDYITWTDGNISVYFAVRDYVNPKIVKVLRGIKHANVTESTSHDIITYDEYLQPLLPPNVVNPCDVGDDYNHQSCDHLCLLKPGLKKVCSCSFGYTLSSDGKTCVAVEWLKDNFLLYVDPLLRTMYQQSFLKMVPLPESAQDVSGEPRPISLGNSQTPRLSAYDMTAETFYWLDEAEDTNYLKKISFINRTEQTVVKLSKHFNVRDLDTVPQTGQILFTHINPQGAIYLVDPKTGITLKMSAAGNFLSRGVTVDQYTGDVYWIDSTNLSLPVIYKCGMVDGSCNQSNGRKKIMEWKFGYPLIGLTIELLGRRLIIYSSNSVFDCNDDGLVQLIFGKNGANFTGVAMIRDFLFYTDWNSRSVYKVDTTTGAEEAITDPQFNRLTDLKPYRKQVFSTTPGGSSLSGGAIAGIVIGSLLLLLLLLCCCCWLLLPLLARRRRRRPPPYKGEAHDNPTYMTHAQVVAAAAGHTINSAALKGVIDGDVKKEKKDLDLKKDSKVLGYPVMIPSKKEAPPEKDCVTVGFDGKQGKGWETFQDEENFVKIPLDNPNYPINDPTKSPQVFYGKPKFPEISEAIKTPEATLETKKPTVNEDFRRTPVAAVSVGQARLEETSSVHSAPTTLASETQSICSWTSGPSCSESCAETCVCERAMTSQITPAQDGVVNHAYQDDDQTVEVTPGSAFMTLGGDLNAGVDDRGLDDEDDAMMSHNDDEQDDEVIQCTCGLDQHESQA